MSGGPVSMTGAGCCLQHGPAAAGEGVSNKLRDQERGKRSFRLAQYSPNSHNTQYTLHTHGDTEKTLADPAVLRMDRDQVVWCNIIIANHVDVGGVYSDILSTHFKYTLINVHSTNQEKIS